MYAQKDSVWIQHIAKTSIKIWYMTTPNNVLQGHGQVRNGFGANIRWCRFTTNHLQMQMIVHVLLNHSIHHQSSVHRHTHPSLDFCTLIVVLVVLKVQTLQAVAAQETWERITSKGALYNKSQQRMSHWKKRITHITKCKNNTFWVTNSSGRSNSKIQTMVIPSSRSTASQSQTHTTRLAELHRRAFEASIISMGDLQEHDAQIASMKNYIHSVIIDAMSSRV